MTRYVFWSVLASSKGPVRGRGCHWTGLTFAIAVGISILIMGCSKSKPSAQPLPPEYRTLAENLALDIKLSPDQFGDNMGISERLATVNGAIMSLRAIKSSDQDIVYVAAQAQEALSEAVKRMERINALPKPPGAVELGVLSFIDGFIGRLTGNVLGACALGYARAKEVAEKQAAIIAEVQALIAALEKADAARQLLPKIAEKYSATFCDSTDRIVVDFDESWGWFGPDDRCRFENRGAALQDCTIVVQLTGARGDVRKNVHFVKEWPANSVLYARYAPGHEILDRQVGRMTVYNVKQVDMTIYSPEFATLIKYVYEGAEKDRDFAERCKSLKFTGRYQPFVPGFFWDTQRGMYFTLDGVEWIPKCRVEVTFRRGSESKSWFWNLDYWKKGDEKWFGTPKGQLTFDPDYVDLTISFPGTSYKYSGTWTVNH